MVVVECCSWANHRTSTELNSTVFVLLGDVDPSVKLLAHSGRGNAGPERPALGGGRYGIRTHGDPEATTAFEAAPFVRSGNLPFQILPFAEATTINIDGHM